ncbi:terminase large subunit [Bradyrhizobium elkanii]|uniref:terminase large subunit n=1 Tax=Bradyrhizobium elkanii TaxID=29448 RepID=UPI00216A998E|nr:terminase TerL endonuclease subunit [Bradyrhizobium elkanii]MCS3690936.1 phage terminase large subunit-like protein [Bradyrhizobium elkanii]
MTKAKRTKTSSSTTKKKPVDRATAYAEAVVAGRMVAGPHVRNACRRHLDDLKRKDIRFDDEAAAKVLRFFEERLRLSEGQFEDQPFRSAPAQDFILGSLFGWKKLDGTRRFRRAYIEQGKGNGKSPLAGGVGLYGLTADGEAGAEIYSAGATKDQAGILFRDAVKMVNRSPSLASRLKPSGGPGREFNLAYLKNSSFFRPVSRETKKTGSGPRPHFALVDELHEHPDAGIIEMLERGFKFRRQPLVFMITNSGSDRNSACWTEHEHAVKVAAGNRDAKDDDAFYLGEVIDDSTFSYVCALDVDDDPLNDPSCWIKANPLLGVTITKEYLSGVVAQARDQPPKLNGILRLHFCVWTEAESAWMTREILEPCLADFDPIDHHGKPVWMGCDLSQNKDITALAWVAKTGEVEEGEHKGKPTFDAWAEMWTPGDTLDARAIRDKQPYRLWADQGFLNTPPGKSISYRQVAQAVAEADHEFDIQCLAFDRYAFKRGLEPECDELGLSVEYVEHPQGGTRKGKPTEAMKTAAEDAGREPEGLWMPGSVRHFEELLLEGRIRIRRNPVVISAIMSAVTEKDRWENYWLSKERAVNKIDAAVALAMAVGAAISYEGGSRMSAYETRPLLVV